MASTASVPVAPVKFVHRVDVGMITIDSVPCAWDMLFAIVVGVLDSALVVWMMILGVIIVHSGH